MEHELDAAHRVVHALVRAELALDDLDAETVQVRAVARREVVEHAHVVAALEQGAHEVRADEAAAPGDERLHSSPPATAASPKPSHVTAWSGTPATMPTAFQVPAATRIQPAATSPKKT